MLRVRRRGRSKSEMEKRWSDDLWCVYTASDTVLRPRGELCVGRITWLET